MGFNIGQGLMAAGNFGVGFQQGQANAMQLQMQKLAMAQAQLAQQQQAQKMQQQQALSDYAMATFNPTITPPGAPINGAAPSAQPAGDMSSMASGGVPAPPQAPQDQMDTTISQMDQLANKAASIGDLDHYTQLSTNAANLRLAQSNMSEHGAAAKLADARRQMINYQQVAGFFAGLDPTSPTFADEFKQAQLQAESLPTTSPEEAKNISGWTPSATLLRNIVQGGMSASQAAAERHRQIQEQERQRMDQFHMDMAQRNATRADKAETFREQDKTRGDKVGKIVPSPTKEDIASAANIIGPIIFPDGQVNEDDPSYKTAVTTLASRAKAYQQQHRTVPYTTALATVAQKSKEIGEFTSATAAVAPKKFLGLSIPGTGEEGTPGKFQPKGDDSSTALPLPANPKSHQSYIPNKYYNVPGHGPMMWVVRPDGTSGFDPNS